MASSTCSSSQTPQSLSSVRRQKAHAARTSFQRAVSARLNKLEALSEQILGGLALLLPSYDVDVVRKSTAVAPPGLDGVERAEYYDISDGTVDAVVQTDIWEPLVQRTCDTTADTQNSLSYHNSTSNHEIAHFEGEWVEESNQSTFSLHIHDGKIVFQTGKFEAELLQSDKGWCGALLNTESGVTKGEILLSPARLPDGEPVLISRHRSKSDEWGPATLAVKI